MCLFINSLNRLAILSAALLILAAGSPVEENPGDAIPITWKTLTDVTFKRRFNQEVELYFLYPAFGPSVKALAGKKVSIRGYMIPVDEWGQRYVISAKPMAQCFFCGGAGPESLMELGFRRKGQRFKTDEIRTVKGILALNPDDIEHLNYILKEVEVVQ